MIFELKNKNGIDLYLLPKFALPVVLVVAVALAAYEAFSSILFAILGFAYLYLSTDIIRATPEGISVKIAPLNTSLFYPLYWNLFLSENVRIHAVSKDGNFQIYGSGLGGIPVSIYRTPSEPQSEQIVKILTTLYRK